MGYYTEIPVELYGRWLEVVNEFGEIIEKVASDSQEEEQVEATQTGQVAGDQPPRDLGIRQVGRQTQSQTQSWPIQFLSAELGPVTRELNQPVKTTTKINQNNKEKNHYRTTDSHVKKKIT